MMLERFAGAAALTLAAGAAAIEPGVPVPEVWHLLGYPFEAAGMIAAIFGCACARWWSGNQLLARKAFRWTLDIPISALTFAATCGAVISLRPEPLMALGLGAGIGVLGEGLFKLAQRYVERFDVFGGAAMPAPPMSLPPTPVPPEMTDLTRQFDAPDDQEPKP